MRRDGSAFIGAACLSLLLAAPANAQFGSEPTELELIEVQDDLYVISNPGVPGLVTALVTDDGVLLVDNKFAIDHDNIIELLRSFTDQPVEFVINTHYHNDHTGGNAQLQALDAVVVASDQARATMVAMNQPGLPELTVGDRATLHLGSETVDLYRVTPAHTNGDVIVHLPDRDVLVSGDIFANGPGTSAQLVDHAGGGSAIEWPRAVETALELDFETVIPGHGLVSTRADLEAYHERTLRFRETLSELVSQGRSRDEIESIVRSEFAWEDFHVQMALDGLIEEFQ